MSNLITRHDLFSSPIWQFKYPNFEQEQYDIINYLMRDELYFTDRERNGLQISEGDLHINDEFLVPVRNFIQSSFEQVMDMAGYEPNCGITSMWATRHRQGGFHHEHSHRNSFLAAVFYVFDDRGGAPGTIFKNDNSNLYQIQPRIKKGSAEFFVSKKEIPFTPGTLIVFPSWMSHYTVPSKSMIRVVLSANCMPIGRTNSDHYDQYEYPNPADIGYVNLEKHIKAGYGKS
jgi:hypothetical protein